MNDAAKVIRKKVKPYPFGATLDPAGLKKPIEVLLVDKVGLMAKVNTQILHVGTYHQIQFELPAMRQSVQAQVRVLKTYDKAINPKEHVVERIAEFHFSKLSDEHKSYILAFMKAIGQK